MCYKLVTPELSKLVTLRLLFSTLVQQAYNIMFTTCLQMAYNALTTPLQQALCLVIVPLAASWSAALVSQLYRSAYRSALACHRAEMTHHE
jgi:hypothetical protein